MHPPLQPPAIRVKHVSKTYRMWSSPFARLVVPGLFRAARMLERSMPRLSRRLQGAVHARMRLHEALHDVDFELQPGESLGIIGPNGSGKSTLLQIIAGVLQPTSGQVRLHGRVAALLELGSGFNPELSGRENIRINAAVLGLTRSQIEQRIPTIIEFADIGNYIDEPVKTYSSGMALRLAFAVQVHIDPDVLIVDEALAVGDAAFQAKAMERIDHILQRGTTLLFVGHDLNAVKAFCQRAMLLEQGRVVLSGLPDEVITEYLYRTHQQALAKRSLEAGTSLVRTSDGYGLDDGHVAQATINGGTHASLRHGDQVRIELQVRLRADVEAPCVILDVLDGRGLQLTGRRIPLDRVDQACTVPVNVSFHAGLQQGIYRIRLRLVNAPSLANTTAIARHEGTLSFEVVDDCRSRFTGLFPLEMQVDTP
ncbi:MAG: ABC transporter ATP-binding protein [Pseudomonadota bacterium]